jgi:hypothetical protein
MNLRRHLKMRRSDRLARLLTEQELAYLSRAVFRQRIDAPDDAPSLAAQLDPLISVARSSALAAARAGEATEQCDGTDECRAIRHMHGCYSDDGTNCDHPSEHAARTAKGDA